MWNPVGVSWLDLRWDLSCSELFTAEAPFQTMKKSDWVVRPKKANMENGEDGKVIIEWYGKMGGVEVQGKV